MGKVTNTESYSYHRRRPSAVSQCRHVVSWSHRPDTWAGVVQSRPGDPPVQQWTWTTANTALSHPTTTTTLHSVPSNSKHSSNISFNLELVARELFLLLAASAWNKAVYAISLYEQEFQHLLTLSGSQNPAADNEKTMIFRPGRLNILTQHHSKFLLPLTCIHLCLSEPCTSCNSVLLSVARSASVAQHYTWLSLEKSTGPLHNTCLSADT